jgi:hypothetical protein
MQQWCVLKLSVVLAAAFLFAGCGGGSKTNNTVAQVNLTPATISMVAGQVSRLGVSALNSAGNAVTTTFTFTTSNPRLATVSPAGEVCAGVWDSIFVTCNGNDASGNPLIGTAVITATGGGISSGPVQVSVHPAVTSVTVEPVSGCFSQKQTHQFVAHAFNGATEITSLIGGFTWNSTNAGVVAVDANGLATAGSPGIAGVVAVAGSATSPAVNFRSCMPVDIRVHVLGDPTTSETMNVTDTKTIEADITDENGTAIAGATGITLVSNNPEVVTVTGPNTGATITAQSPGGAGIVGVCAPPTCGSGLNQAVYSNLFSVSVNGTSPATTVFVASKDLATLSTVIPIDTSKTPPAAGNPIGLPGHPNSMVFAANDTRLYVGTDAGLVSIDPTTNASTVVAPEAVGVVLAVSPDGNRAIVSNAPIEPNVSLHRLRVFDAASSTLQTFIVHNVVSGAFTPDGFKAYMGATDGNIYVFSPQLTFQNVAATGSFKSAVVLPSGQFAFFANTSALSRFNVCNNSQTTDVATNSAPQLVGAVLNTNQIVAVDSTGVNFESVTPGPAAAGFCPPASSITNQFIDFGIGAFTARQLIVPGNGAHIAVLPAGRNFILAAISGGGPGIIPLAAGATEALSGSMTLDGNTLWVGVNPDHTVHRINLLTSADEFQIQPSVNGGSGSTPDLIAVRPK